MKSASSGDAGEGGQPQRIGPYRLEQRLGEGGMGAVWQAWDERLKRAVAIKRVLPQALGTPRARERFRREAEAEARLNHPAIVHVYDLVETDECDWIVMELVAGRTLSEILAAGPLDLLQAVRLARDVAEGLAEAHAHGILHRDLKTSNVMVTEKLRAKILDFGIAKQLKPLDQETTLSQPNMLVGTLYAMSPEQFQGLPLDARSDLFSFGSLLYEMVTGTSPFRAETPTATMSRICTYQPPPVRALKAEAPPALSDLIEHLLEKEPAHRPQSAAEVVHVLEGLEAAMRGSSASRQAGAASWQQDTLQELPNGPGSQAVLGDGPSRVPGIPLRWPRLRGAAGLVLLLTLVALVTGILLRGRDLLPASSYTLYEDGMALLARPDKKGNTDRAIEIFREIVARDAQYAPAYAGLARAYWFKHGYEGERMWAEQALPAAQQAVKLDGYLAVARVSLGLALASLDRPEEAKREFARAVQLDPLDADAHYGLARVSEAQGQLPEAEAEYKQAVRLRPDRLFYDDLGSLYLRTGRLPEAKAAFQRSIQLAPDGFIGYRNLGVADYTQGQLDEAASQFQKALQIQPDATLYGNLGTIYFTQGLYPQSVDAFEKAVEMPQGSNNYLLWGNLGDAYRWMPDHQEQAREAYTRAIQLLRPSLRSSGGEPTLRSRLALYLAKRGDRVEALAESSRAEAAAAEDASVWFRLTVAYEVLGERDKALAALARALQAGVSRDEVQLDPELLRLRQDVRYHHLLARR